MINQNNIFNKLPDDVINYILLFNEQLVFRNSKLIIINKINKEDIRYKILEKRPLIFINKWVNKSVLNSITIYNNILDNKSVIDQYLYIYKSIQIYKHF
jgi:hypothetical protein